MQLLCTAATSLHDESTAFRRPDNLLAVGRDLVGGRHRWPFRVKWRLWRDYDPARPLRPWLAGIAYRVAHRHLRRRWREVLEDRLDQEDLAAAPDERVAAKGAHELVVPLSTVYTRIRRARRAFADEVTRLE